VALGLAWSAEPADDELGDQLTLGGCLDHRHVCADGLLGRLDGEISVHDQMVGQRRSGYLPGKVGELLGSVEPILVGHAHRSRFAGPRSDSNDDANPAPLRLDDRVGYRPRTLTTEPLRAPIGGIHVERRVGLAALERHGGILRSARGYFG